MTQTPDKTLRDELLLDVMNAVQVAIYNFSRGDPFCFASRWHEENFRAEAVVNSVQERLK